MMMTLLFRLPVDLQIHILNTFFVGKHADDLLYALSGLDVACTSRACRQAFTSLISSPFLDLRDNEMLDCGVDRIGFLEWIAGRQVQLKSLCLTEATVLSRPLDKQLLSIESIVIEHIRARAWLSSILLACPNITAFVFKNDWHCINPALCQMLASCQLRRLKRFINPNFNCPYAHLFAIILPVAHQLVELRTLSCNAVVFAAVLQCHQLQALELALHRDQTVDNLILLFQACPFLSDLKFHFLPEQMGVDEVRALLLAGRHQLKHFSAELAIHLRSRELLHAQLHKEFSWLETFELF